MRVKQIVLSALILFTALSVALPVTASEPYFSTPDMPNALRYLPAPPAYSDMRFAYDSARYEWGKRMRPTARGEKARLDAEFSINRMAAIFSPVLGIEISPDNTPQLWKLLADATATTGEACDSAKITYMRPRPYMVYNEPTLVPEDEEPLRHNGSYPSGHTTLGWSTALILCEIYPAKQDEILREGFEYGQSRVIAGFHWQSDVDAARVVTGAAFARLHTSRAYLKQLRKAQKEVAAKTRKAKADNK
ncbi:MAG: phosphatase PAP2 family protein [Paludibacteraceae bacterium]|nr:phosphatase PAP2 family protein [Paludibacteraceae bacterium]